MRHVPSGCFGSLCIHDAVVIQYEALLIAMAGGVVFVLSAFVVLSDTDGRYLLLFRTYGKCGGAEILYLEKISARNT